MPLRPPAGFIRPGFDPLKNPDVPLSVIESIVIATTGNATNFGDLTQSRSQLAACSNGHGGL